MIKSKPNQEKIAKLRAQLAEYINCPQVIAFQKYLSLPGDVKSKLSVDWKQYYADVKIRKPYLRFQEQYQSWKKNDFGTVKVLATEARADREAGVTYSRQPSSYDPEWLATCWEVSRKYELEKALTQTINQIPDDAEFAKNLFNF